VETVKNTQERVKQEYEENIRAERSAQERRARQNYCQSSLHICSITRGGEGGSISRGVTGSYVQTETSGCTVCRLIGYVHLLLSLQTILENVVYVMYTLYTYLRAVFRLLYAGLLLFILS